MESTTEISKTLKRHADLLGGSPKKQYISNGQTGGSADQLKINEQTQVLCADAANDEVDEAVIEAKVSTAVAVGETKVSTAAVVNETVKEAKVSAAAVVDEAVNEAKVSAAAVVDEVVNETKVAVALDEILITSQFNAIGALQEFCLAKKLNLPNYECENKIGPLHNPQFIMSCIISEYQEFGNGKTKKIAKSAAAYKMLKRLIDNQIDNTKIMVSTKNCENVKKIASNERLVEWSTQDTNKNLTFCNNYILKSNGNELKLPKIDFKDKQQDWIKILNDISVENKFNIHYIEEQLNNDEYQCLLIITTLPIGATCGLGVTPKLAKETATRTALALLNALSKK